jgi:hypothetical protein
MDGKRGIHITNFLYYIQEKCMERQENHEEGTVAMFDGFQPEATKRRARKFIASGWTPSNIVTVASSRKKLGKAGKLMDIIDSGSILGHYYYYLLKKKSVLTSA